MNQLLFPEDQSWLEGNFKSLNHLTNTFEQVSDFIKKHYSHLEDSKNGNQRGCFFVEEIDVLFLDPKDCPRTLLRVGFSENKLLVHLPKLKEYTKETCEQIRLKVQGQLAPMVKESHARAIVLFWRMLEPEAREKIEKLALESLGGIG